jgi:ABC-type nitrate/sulfonate/bicarbonate transport system substrate-binding protein
MNKPIRVGLLRLVDSAPVILAQASGLFRDQGIDVRISVEPSWSNIADKLTYGVLDAAVMLPPLALAACAGLRGPTARLVVPMSLSQGGNAIVVGNEAAAALAQGGATPRLRLLEWLQAQQTKPRFAVVHAFSTGWRPAGRTRTGTLKPSSSRRRMWWTRWPPAVSPGSAPAPPGATWPRNARPAAS